MKANTKHQNVILELVKNRQKSCFTEGENDTPAPNPLEQNEGTNEPFRKRTKRTNWGMSNTDIDGHLGETQSVFSKTLSKTSKPTGSFLLRTWASACFCPFYDKDSKRTKLVNAHSEINDQLKASSQLQYSPPIDVCHRIHLASYCQSKTWQPL